MSDFLTGPYAGFIMGAYGITFSVLAGLVLWVWLTAVKRRRQMARLEEAGMRRQSSNRGA